MAADIIRRKRVALTPDRRTTSACSCPAIRPMPSSGSTCRRSSDRRALSAARRTRRLTDRRRLRHRHAAVIGARRPGAAGLRYVWQSAAVCACKCTRSFLPGSKREEGGVWDMTRLWYYPSKSKHDVYLADWPPRADETGHQLCRQVRSTRCLI